jgi:hypothetical protein
MATKTETKSKVLTGNAGQAAVQASDVVATTPVVKQDNLKFADYRKCNAVSLKGTFNIALIKAKNGKRYTRITNASGKVVLLVGAREDGTGTWNRTELDILASTDSKREEIRDAVEV